MYCPGRPELLRTFYQSIIIVWNFNECVGWSVRDLIDHQEVLKALLHICKEHGNVIFVTAGNKELWHQPDFDIQFSEFARLIDESGVTRYTGIPTYIKCTKADHFHFDNTQDTRQNLAEMMECVGILITFTVSSTMVWLTLDTTFHPGDGSPLTARPPAWKTMPNLLANT